MSGPNATVFNPARTSAPGGTFMPGETQPNHTPHADSSPRQDSRGGKRQPSDEKPRSETGRAKTTGACR